MSFDDYANHIYQKHRLAIALSIIRIKPKNITTKDFLEQLKSKFGEKMVDDDDVTVCSDDFLMDDDNDSRDSPTILKDFDEEIIGHQIFLNDVDEVEPLHRIYNNSQTTFKETAQSNTENITKTNTVDIKITEKDKNLSKNLTTQDLNEPKELNTDVISTNFDLNAKMELGVKYHQDPQVGEDINIPKTAIEDTAATFYDSQKTQIYSIHGYSQNYTHYSQSQNNVTIPKQYLYKNRNNTNRTDATYVETEENSEIVKENNGIHDKINNNCKIWNDNNAITEERITKIVPNNNAEENAHPNAFITQENNDIFITNDNNKDSETNKELVDHSSQYSQDIDDYFNEMQNIHSEKITEIINMDVDDNEENNPKNTISNLVTENKARNDAKAKYYNVNLHHFGDFTEDLLTNQSVYVITGKPDENFEEDYTNASQNKDLSESITTNVHQKPYFTENTNTKSTEEFASNRTNLLRNKDLTEEYRITEEDCDSEEIISFKVLEEFNKVKLFVRRPNRRMSCDSYSSDSGYKSDSQRSNRSALQLSGTWLNQSGSCLFHYLLQCPLVASTRDITSEIAQVLGELIDKLHDDEKYPSFLEELLETIDGELGQVFEGANGEENEFLKKDERIQRILLLNKSIHIQAHTIEKITKILEKFHANITQIDSTYELQNIDEIENVSYIFHLLEILLKKYLKNKKNDSQSESTTQNYSKEDEKIFKKSTISDIWRKKWNPSQKKIEGSREKKCALKVCSDVLNKIVVDCVSSYSLVAYSALKCFNSMQN